MAVSIGDCSQMPHDLYRVLRSVRGSGAGRLITISRLNYGRQNWKRDKNLRRAPCSAELQGEVLIAGSGVREALETWCPTNAQSEEIAADVKDLQREIKEFGQRMDTVECIHDAQEEEIDQHRKVILDLQDSIRDLQYQLEDLENRLRSATIRIRGLPLPARLCHRAGRPAQSPGQTQDILTCLHYYHQ
ncbi:hypothetical protein NDU88_004928 [Pleurodeles waltl]|uniref:Uncharacterized protein n=1 Tax=Pleurodeles waltl TaxID=8319 RepID=A0AAV7LSF1_PLEWA|nr:hypothetical protein NDU88_004928 [Pleurodeles waltl]